MNLISTSIFTPPAIGDWNFQQRMQAARLGARWFPPVANFGAFAEAAPSGIIPMPPIAVLLGAQSLAMTAIVADRPPGIAAVVSQCKTDLDTIGANLQATIAQAQSQLGANNQAFIDKMNAMKADAKRQVDAAIDQAYSQLEQIGEQNPKSQSLILAAVGEMSTLAAAAETTISSAYDSAISAAESAMSAIASAAEAAAAAAQAAAEAAASAVENAANTVASGVEHIFSGW
jgi:hypothetical protein